MNISFILPCYKKAALFRTMLPVNDCLRVDGVEVVLVLDEPSEEREVLDIVRNNPDSKFRVIVNDWDHPWRPPCIPLNVGVRHALSDHVVFCSPESALLLPTPYYLQTLIREDFRMCWGGICWMTDEFAIGDSPAVLHHKMQVAQSIGHLWNIGTGFFLAPKIGIERIFGFDESRTTYGLDDNDIRIRMARLGYRITIDGRIKIFHAPHDSPPRIGDNSPLRPHIAIFEQEQSWGRAFSRVAYDWRNQK